MDDRTATTQQKNAKERLIKLNSGVNEADKSQNTLLPWCDCTGLRAK